MANKITAPFTETEVDPSDPAGSAKNVMYGIGGVALALAIFAGGQSLYNWIANSTPDAVQPVEMF
jgi:hypothetical protein